MAERLKITQKDLDLLPLTSSLPFRLRIATVRDLGNLVSLINEAYMYENVGAGAFKKPNALRSDPAVIEEAMAEGVILIAESHRGQTIGSIQYKEILPTPNSDSPNLKNGYFGMLAVDPYVQGQGTGSLLVHASELVAKSKRLPQMEIQVVDHSAHLLTWYAKLGYREFGRKNWDGPAVITRPTQFVLMRKNLRSEEQGKYVGNSF
jgi:predicted N-acetyltransferase YhbS